MTVIARGWLRLAAVLVLGLSTAGCQVIGGIFRAGFWTGMFVALALVVGVTMLRRGRR